MKKLLFILLLVLGAFAVWGISSYNKLVLAESDIAESWSRLESFCRRRTDLVPELAATASRYLPEEQSGLISELADARIQADRFALQDFSQASVDRSRGVQDRVDRAVDALVSALEMIPQTAEDRHCCRLLDQAGQLGIQILNARTDFDHSAQAFNALTQTFPANLAARLFHFREKGRFETAEPASL